MYGLKKIPFDYSSEEFEISLQRNADRFEYYRRNGEETQSKLLFSNRDELLIVPVEPVNLPRQITSFLMIEFVREIMMQPGRSSQIYLTFPIEIGVFTGRKDKYEVFDIFSRSTLKYTLYGEPRNGVICKYWLSKVFLQEPETNPLLEGVLQLNITNSSHEWVKVNKALFNANGMKIYYNNDNVSLKANMKVLEEEAAEVEFNNSPLHNQMKKSPELFSTRKLSVSSKKAVMLEGI